MNIRLILHILSVVLMIVCGFMLLPILVAFIYKEYDCVLVFSIIAIAVILICLLFFLFTSSKREKKFKTKDGFVLVSLCWLFIGLIGALPYQFTHSVNHFADGFFESTSGFTTTGATILNDIEILPRSVLFWRALTHWIGGMGIIALTVAIFPILGISGLNLMKAEAPGPSIEKISAKVASTAKILWVTYLALTFLEVFFLVLGKMSVFDAFAHAFSTISTGGFSTKNASIGAYNSRYIEWVVAIFMFLSGINFSLHFKLITGKWKELLRNSELKWYLAIIFIGVALISTNLMVKEIVPLFDGLRDSFFQITSIITTSGFSTADYQSWPWLSQLYLFALFFIGGCAGSTSGGVKVVRLVTLAKVAHYQAKSLLFPQGVFTVKLNSQPLHQKSIYDTVGFVFLYFVLILILSIISAGFGMDLETAFSSALSMLGNVGPGFGAVGPTHTMAFVATPLKWIYSFAMIVGRLEIFTVIVIFLPRFWKS